MNNIINKNFSINGVEFTAFDIDGSKTLSAIDDEFKSDVMGISNMNLQESPVIIDIGANVGIVSFFFAKKYPNAKIFAFEPHPTNFENLKRGLQLNQIKNIKVFNLAVSSESNTNVKIHLHENNTSASSVFRFLPHDPFVEVKTISLDDIISDNEISHIDFLKIDCEGSEFDILENSKLFKDNKIIIENMFIEFHRFMEKLQGKNVQNTISKLNEIQNCKGIKTIIF